MYIQGCVKGIASGEGFDWDAARGLVESEIGLISNWWRNRGRISPADVADILNIANLHRHLNDYEAFGHESPFISLAAGSVVRDAAAGVNHIQGAVETAQWFATDGWSRPGALFYCWVPVGMNPAVEVRAVAESVRELHVYREYLPFQPEGEITAKVNVPANQIERVEWWDPTAATPLQHDWPNPRFVPPTPLTTLRDFF